MTAIDAGIGMGPARLSLSKPQRNALQRLIEADGIVSRHAISPPTAKVMLNLRGMELVEARSGVFALTERGREQARLHGITSHRLA